MIPLAFLNHRIFRELLLMAGEEFGLTGCHPLTLPCESFVMEYIKALVSMTCCIASHPSLVVEPLSEPMILRSF
ncbi:hypothetical protein AMTRI_Chr02g256540 [Amborella trichopoda]